jgi:hypothetical protein
VVLPLLFHGFGGASQRRPERLLSEPRERVMQSSFLRVSVLLLGVIAVIALAEAPARAQLPEELRFRTVFPFVVGNRELPAGTYDIQRVGDDQFLYMIRGPKSAILETNFVGKAPALNASTGEVIFRRYGDTLVMQEVWDPSSATGIVSTVKFKGEAAALERAGHVAENIPATVVVPALSNGN